MTITNSLGPFCAHRKVENKREETQAGNVVREWWECTDCNTTFLPETYVELRLGREVGSLELQVATLREKVDQYKEALREVIKAAALL